jgi:hypothetical protein
VQPSPPAGAIGCPAASQVYVASYLTQDDGATSAGHAGWVLPLFDRRVGSLDNQPEYAAIDGAAARSLGVPAAPSSAWMMVPGQPPCKATIGAYYAAAVEGGEPNITHGVELTGCAAPPKDDQQDAGAIVIVSDLPPTECQLLTPQPVATRLGETDAQKHWQRPIKETPMPPAFAAALPAHDCRAPGCETLWTVAQVDVSGRPVAWAGAVNWLTIPPGATPASQCDWKTETFAGFFVAGPDGRAVKLSEGQDHPLLLSTVLADASGPRVVVAEGPGEYATYDVAAGMAQLGRHLTWLQLPRDAYTMDERIGPMCGSDDVGH